MHKHSLHNVAIRSIPIILLSFSMIFTGMITLIPSSFDSNAITHENFEYIGLDSISDSKIVVGNSLTDSDNDKISDTLNSLINAVDTKNLGTLEISQDEISKIEVIIDLTTQPTQEIITELEDYGAEILSIYEHVIYAVAAKVPANVIPIIAQDYQVSYIEENAQSQSHLDTGTINVGARGSSWVWDADTPVKGNSSYAIAVLDTGVDTSHSDMENVIYFEDFTDAGYANGTTGYDYDGHGTHCASIAAGTGSADTNPQQINQTFAGSFPSTTGNSYLHYFEVKNNQNNPDTLLNLTWDTSNGGSVWIGIKDASDDSWESTSSTSSSSPIIDNAGKLSSGWYYAVCVPNDSDATLQNYSLQVTQEYNYTISTDSTPDPIFSGVAPNSNLVSLKVLDDYGVGSSIWFTDALEWLSENGTLPQYNITVVSMSLGFDAVSPTVDSAINNLVDDGFVCVTTSGNDGVDGTIHSPGTAANATTVGAVNDAFEIAYYSTNGDYVYNKPDVVAPGGTAASSGSNSPNNLIIAADTNNGEADARNIDDVSPDDYIGLQGTSMACPFVAGIAQLAIDKMLQNSGEDWVWSAENAQKVKQLICMSTWEVEGGENFASSDQNQQGINRTGRDKAEGYGMVRADAVMQALNETYSNQFIEQQFYLDRRNDTYSKDYKVVVFPVDLTSGTNYNLTLEVPSTGDFDLIIYDDDYNATNGDPIVYLNSTKAGLGTNENITFTPTSSGTYYWSIRAADGYGLCNVSLVTPITTSVSSNVTKLIASENFDAELECTFEDTQTSSPLVGKTISVSTDLGSVNTSSAVTDSQGKIHIKLTGEEISGASEFATITFSSTSPVFESNYQIEFEANDEPVLNNPADIYYGVTNTSSIHINWTVADSNYTTEANYTLSVTGSAYSVSNGNWASSKKVEVDVSGLAIGTYYYILEVNDGYGGSDIDTVMISVSEFEYNLIVTPNVSYVVADDSVDVLLECQFLYQNTNPEIGASVSISTDLGTLNQTSATTDDDGKIYLIITGETISKPIVQANITFLAPSMDGLDITYNISFVINDVPILSSPLDLLFEAGGTQEQIIRWNATDMYYKTAANYTIWLSSGNTTTVLTSGTWSPDALIAYTATNLNSGTYNLTIVIDDGYGGQMTDNVLVIVSEPSTFSYFWIFVAADAFILLIGVIVVIRKKKNSES